ncbi:MAG: hypothetical protein HC883_06190 [Bdellovibrionaceae bacterium]|nr:hypothetical protein [Pseudobdellovibrionaceae bacterium]
MIFGVQVYLGYKSGVKAKKKSVINVLKTRGCTPDGPTIEELAVRSGNFRKMVSGFTTELILVKGDECLRKGTVLPISLISRESKGDRIIYRVPGPEAKITQIIKKPYSALNEKTKKWVSKKLEIAPRNLKKHSVLYR